MYDAMIIGAGPAGCSCALWLKMLGFKSVLMDKNDRCGGLQLLSPYSNDWIASSVGQKGVDVAEALHENMLAHGIPMMLGVKAMGARVGASGVEVDLDNGKQVSAKVLVMALGVQPKTAGLASRLGLLVGPGKAIASTDFGGAKVAILGGGDSAFENYRFAKERGAASVAIFARSIKARQEMLSGTPPSDVIIGAYELDEKKNTVNEEKFDHILVLYGYEVPQEHLLGLSLAMRPDGLVSTDSNAQTSMKSVYAIGEIAGRMHPCCITSMADGVIAAKAIQRALEAGAVEKYIGLAKRAVNLAGRIVK